MRQVAELEAVISRENQVFLKASEDQKTRFEETEQRIQAMISNAQNDHSANRDKIITDLHDVSPCSAGCGCLTIRAVMGRWDGEK